MYMQTVCLGYFSRFIFHKLVTKNFKISLNFKNLIFNNKNFGSLKVFFFSELKAYLVVLFYKSL